MSLITLSIFGQFNCQKNESKIIVTKKYEETKGQYLDRVIKKQITFYKRSYSQNKINEISTALQIAELEFGINPIDLIALISLESNFKYNARSKNKNSTDFGFTQQNSCCINDRYRKAARVLNAYEQNYDIKNKFDIKLNILSSAIFLNQIRNALIKKGAFSKFRMFAVYNVGWKVKGHRLKIAKAYYKTFCKTRKSILDDLG